ncbi:hypothetical protein JW930_06085 [Candidatus Woesearchaeota archaeon]|nr:hypothetical protein [Candidatus Woesearchaeota archaeon]
MKKKRLVHHPHNFKKYHQMHQFIREIMSFVIIVGTLLFTIYILVKMC